MKILIVIPLFFLSGCGLIKTNDLAEKCRKAGGVPIVEGSSYRFKVCIRPEAIIVIK